MKADTATVRSRIDRAMQETLGHTGIQITVKAYTPASTVL